MRKYFREYLIFVFALTALLSTFSYTKQKLASYLLTSELMSDKKVNEIIARQNQPVEVLSQAIFNNQTLDTQPSLDEIAQYEQNEENVLGETSDRWIEVNLSQQRVYAWEGGRQVFNFLVSTGKWAPTPTGDFRIWTKLRSTTMKGGSKALGTYYYLPNVPCTMYFYKGYGLHGTYWHNNFGHPMSHGCVNMRTPDACTLFDWASVGTRVNVHK